MATYQRHQLMRLRLWSLVLLAVSVVATPVRAQRLKDRVLDLFRFGDCGNPLCLDGSVNAANGHGDHYLPDVIATNSSVFGFLTAAIGTSAGSIPLSASSSGQTFKFVNGLPVKTSASAGPIFGERAQTLGRGRVLLGASLTSISFETLRGTPLDQLVFNLVHEDRPPTGLGDPLLENDHIEVRLALDMNLRVTTFQASYGLTDGIDVGVAVPIVHTAIQGRSTAQIYPFGSTAVHFFSGTPENPGLRASAATFGSATGFGDIAVRIKGRLASGSRFGLAVMADARLPTGAEEDLLGSGHLSIRTTAVASAQFGSFSPHLNLGFLGWSGREHNDAVLATVGFDQPLSSWATLAIDVLSEWQLGSSTLRLPGPVRYQLPFPRTVVPSNIADRRDHRVLGSVGAKFQTRGGPLIVGSVLAPLRVGGLQPYLAWNLGLEFGF
jgi:hypothetical protein